MWLLNTKTAMLQYFVDCKAVGEYAILSHVWGSDEQTFQDIRQLAALVKDDKDETQYPIVRAAPKIRECCRFAASLGFKWVWIDTCCIDKTSSAELSEAINSMFQWYSESKVCIAYLADVPDLSDTGERDSAIRTSKWFTRGWTLQELLAPYIVVFVSRSWTWIGTKTTLASLLHLVTGVEIPVLSFQRRLADISVARRMSWAAQRVTTRVEDRSYSLLGIFGVNMPTIYGEGEAAFRRLQEEIIKISPDQTLFAWDRVDLYQPFLATAPSAFRRSATMDTLDMASIPAAVNQFLTMIKSVRAHSNLRSKRPRTHCDAELFATEETKSIFFVSN
jgi:hypothetical protein